jgi:glycosyltransferase involved in cell wall biosynthesis
MKSNLLKDGERNMVSVVVPVKDEVDNVAPLADDIRTALRGRTFELIFIDDGSTDGTHARIAKLAAQDRRVKVVRLRRCFGQSAAMQAGFDAAAGEVIVTLDGDRQNDPADIPLLLNKLDEGYDAVLGLRANRQDKVLLRKLPSRMANWLIRRVLRVPFRDFGCTLRAMRRDLVANMTLYGEMHRFITAMILQQGAHVTQVPVRHHPRTAGATKYTLSRTVRVVLDLLTVKFLASYQTRPMHLFGSLGLAFLAGGAACLAAAIIMKYTTGPGMTANPLTLLGVMVELIGVQFLTLGLIGEVLARIYFESQGKAAYTVKDRINFHDEQQQRLAHAA